MIYVYIHVFNMFTSEVQHLNIKLSVGNVIVGLSYITAEVVKV